ncbi:metallophosphoesterase family protein [Novosphingobium sp.]|uniref:metallophosphoesterase family protein n=1 Tax=Novosphingobium sp. TaxID=1874826 RepID=UPI0025CF6052|nr:metallophosphoesterase family protein [Novosphingobium sp.]MCC6924991.1 serine/threonine protein phosphatase [Novosphingobium sp.]
MLKSLRSLLGLNDGQPAPAIPAGQRVYAVGDIHGCLGLFEALVAAIEADDARRGASATTLVLLGDLVDRGPDSAGVIRLARQLAARRTVRILLGNHEEMFLDALESEEVLRHFLRYGGRETVLSYPVDPATYHRAELDETLALMRAAVPAEDIAFLRGFEDQVLIGDYLFVHAGIRPGVPLDEQRAADLRWIREPFLSHRESHGPVVVHGHTIFERPDFGHNRIGIDTGAYRTGRLTALGLEGTTRWLIEAVQDELGAVSATQRSLG